MELKCLQTMENSRSSRIHRTTFAWWLSPAELALSRPGCLCFFSLFFLLWLLCSLASFFSLIFVDSVVFCFFFFFVFFLCRVHFCGQGQSYHRSDGNGRQLKLYYACWPLSSGVRISAEVFTTQGGVSFFEPKSVAESPKNARVRKNRRKIDENQRECRTIYSVYHTHTHAWTKLRDSIARRT